MIKIQEKVKEVVLASEEATFALSAGFMNLSAYAKLIKKEISEKTKKNVSPASIVVALSRLKKEIGDVHPLVKKVVINNITTKSPLTEIVFEKNSLTLEQLSSVSKNVKKSGDDFMTIILSTNNITVICSDRIKDNVLKYLKHKPQLLQSELASIGLSFDSSYYREPNITFSLLRRIAQKRIVLAETITTHNEIIFIINQKDLPKIVSLFGQEQTG